jgi:tRNA(Ile)-lysidine synthase
LVILVRYPAMLSDLLETAVAAVPGGAWAVGVSGGADSVALLALLRRRADLRCHAVHLDHETRAGESAADARFVAELCAKWGISVTLARRSELETGAGEWPANRSARFRALRLELFRRTCAAQQLRGVILAHHADDQAETILQRLLRGSGPAGLMGMRPQTRVGGLTILRPLLGVRSAQLREFLQAQGDVWREDASNASPAYQRNRVRALLARNVSLAEVALEMGAAMSGLAAWAQACAPVLAETFAIGDLVNLPDVLAAEAARRWLAERGAPRGELSRAVLERLIEMARDAGTPPRRHFPGGLLVARRGGRVGLHGTF